MPEPTRERKEVPSWQRQLPMMLGMLSAYLLAWSVASLPTSRALHEAVENGRIQWAWVIEQLLKLGLMGLSMTLLAACVLWSVAIDRKETRRCLPADETSSAEESDGP